MGQQSKKDYAKQARERREQLEREKKEKQRKQNRIILGVAGGVLALIVIVVGIILLTLPKKNDPEPEEPGSTVSNAPKMEELDFSPIEGDLSADYTPTATETDLVRMTISYTTKTGEQKQGDVYIRLFPDVAPITVANFKSLVASGFYDGTIFHRVYPGFMIQGGSGVADSIKGEFTSNGFENNLQHVRGVLSMARSDDPDSASSSFFIMLEETSSLNKKYASFGYVVSGMETVDEIAQIELGYGNSSIDGTTPTSPVHPVTIESAVFVEKIPD